MSWRLCCAFLALALSLFVQQCQAAEAKEIKAKSADSPAMKRAASLVRRALTSELAGDLERRRTLLAEALKLAPQYPPAHWHSGHVLVDGRWLTIDEAERHFRGDKTLAEYRRLKALHGGTLASELAMARWCHKHGLEAQERFHWTSALKIQPRSAEARKGLALMARKVRLQSRDKIALLKEQAEKAKKEAKERYETTELWAKTLARESDNGRRETLDKLRAVRDVRMIDPLEKSLSRTDEEVGLEVVRVLGAMRDHAATRSLVRHAVFSEFDKVRDAAAAELKKRAVHDFVPMLMGGLSTPIESRFRIVYTPKGDVHYYHELFREGPQTNYAMTTSATATAHVVRLGNGPGRGGVWEVPALDAPAKFAGAVKGAQANIKRTELAVKRANRHAQQLNQRIHDVLTKTTGQSIGNDPTQWWRWWQEYNELYTPPYKSLSEAYRHFDYTYAAKYLVVLSCFPKGTKVWTRTGKRPIEQIRPGDYVLSQHPHTGELAYRPVQAVTLRPPSPLVRLGIGQQELHVTKGHPLWMVGKGWRMAKRFREGDRLHTVNDAVTVERVEEGIDIESYNLMVSGFHTYFVGDAGVLVHDNTLRRPTWAVVPGLLPEADKVAEESGALSDIRRDND